MNKIERAKNIHGDLYDYTKTENLRMHDKVVVSCKTHGDFSVTMSDHIYKRCGCPHCRYEKMINTRKLTGQAYARLTTEEFIDKSIAKYGSLYNYEHVEYVNMHTKVEIECPEHGIWLMTPSEHINGNKGKGSGCPACKQSSGEREVAHTLSKLQVEFIREYKFDGLIAQDTNRPLFCDFYLPSFNAVIEYDGLHHFKPIKYFKTKESSFERTKFLDNLKNDYLHSNGIRLLRIPYYEKDIEKRIQEFLDHIALTATCS